VRALVLVLVLCLIASVLACDGDGFPRLRCELDGVRTMTPCGPRGFQRAARRLLRGVERNLARAERAEATGRPRLRVYQFVLAEAKLAAVDAKRARFAGDGRMDAACASAIGAALATLRAEVAAVRAPLPPPTVAITTTTTTTVTDTSDAPTTTTASTSTTVPTCGNGRLDRGEQCDGTNLFGRTCETLGFTGGELACRPDCLFDNSGCRL
jgi:hypothetical protein